MSALDHLNADQWRGYWIGRHLTLRDHAMNEARNTDHPAVRTACVQAARERNRMLVAYLRRLSEVAA